jgi:hypothetical protein
MQSRSIGPATLRGPQKVLGLEVGLRRIDAGRIRRRAPWAPPSGNWFGATPG